MSETIEIQDIQNTYQEIEGVENDAIILQLGFAKALVARDIKNNKIDTTLEKMATVYMTCHLLYMNYFKTAEDTLNGNTKDKRLTPKIGMGLKASPYGQTYMSLMSNTLEKSDVVSGVAFL